MGCSESITIAQIQRQNQAALQNAAQIQKKLPDVKPIQEKLFANHPNSKLPKFQNFMWDPETKNAEKFKIQGKKATAKKVGLPYQLACPYPIKSSCHVVYKVIKNVNSMGFGLMTFPRYYDQFIGKHIQGSPDGNKYAETILYSFNHTQQKGEIFCEGQQKIQKSPNLHIADGQFLMIEVDFENWQVTFTSQKTKESFKLPESFKGKDFFFNGFMSQNEDSFQAMV